MGNPSIGMEHKSSSKDASLLTRGSRKLQPQGGLSVAVLPRRPSASNLQQYLQSSNEIPLPGQVAKLRFEEKYLSEEVETEGLERLALSHIMSSIKDFPIPQHDPEMRPLMPSPLGLERTTFAASG